MKYADHGFRPLYKNFCIYPMNDTIKEILKDYPGIEDAEGVMVYGYVDHVAGNTVELLGLTKREEGDKFSYLKFPDEARFFVRIEALIDEEFLFVDYGNSHLSEMFKNKIDKLAAYDINDDFLKRRSFAFLDEFRYEYNFDDVQVILHKEGLKLEGVWVRMESLGNGIITGTLLNDPEQEFGAKAGDPIVFFVNETSDKKKQLVANFSPRQKLKKEDLADGKILKKALKVFNSEKNNINMLVVLEFLRDSNVLVPYTKKGVDILASNHKYFYPVFTSSLEMWEYDNKIIKNEMPFLEALKKAESSKKEVEGIVVNAFTDSVVIPKSMFGIIERLESRVEQ